MIEYHENALRVDGTHLWLDTTRTKGLPDSDLFYISHAHADHALPHSKNPVDRRVVASERTARLFRHRCGEAEITACKYNEPVLLNGLRVTLFPAGHILGSSQILMETDRRIVYTGDFRMTKGETAEEIEVKPCDVLIMECTFGKPEYFFPEREKVIEEILRFVQKTLNQNRVPIIYAYSLGKSQEVMKILSEADYSLSVHRKIYEIAKIYEELGVALKGYERFRPRSIKDKVLVMPPYARKLAMVQEIERKRAAIVTGWAVERDAPRRYGVDEAIPLSDHADFVELVAYVLVAKPKRVYTFHGPPDFARYLRRKGFDAEHLPSGQQLRLWDDL